MRLGSGTTLLKMTMVVRNLLVVHDKFMVVHNKDDNNYLSLSFNSAGG